MQVNDTEATLGFAIVTYVTTVTLSLTAAGEYEMRGEPAAVFGPPGRFAVTPAAMDFSNSAFEDAAAAPIVDGGATLVMTAKDAFNNPLGVDASSGSPWNLAAEAYIPAHMVKADICGGAAITDAATFYAAKYPSSR